MSSTMRKATQAHVQPVDNKNWRSYPSIACPHNWTLHHDGATLAKLNHQPVTSGRITSSADKCYSLAIGVWPNYALVIVYHPIGIPPLLLASIPSALLLWKEHRQEIVHPKSQTRDLRLPSPVHYPLEGCPLSRCQSCPYILLQSLLLSGDAFPQNLHT